MNYKKLAVENLCYSLAIENMGYYAESVKGGKHPYEKRTERMEGHNEALSKLHNKLFLIEDYLSASSDEVVDALLTNAIYLRVNDKEEIKLYVLCNDVFYYACADLEDIEPEEVKDLMECYKLSKVYGGMLWASRKRKMKPIDEWFKYFSKEEKELFDAVENNA